MTQIKDIRKMYGSRIVCVLSNVNYIFAPLLASFLAQLLKIELDHRELVRKKEHYNHRRPHQSLDYKTPAEYYFGGYDQLLAVV